MVATLSGMPSRASPRSAARLRTVAVTSPDQSQARSWHGICRPTALAALVQLGAAATRGALAGSFRPYPPGVTRPVS
jgi:hypothetical protein